MSCRLFHPTNDRLAQVFSNLITNAVKYRSDQKPEIHITVTESGPEWVFKITDNGIGIDMKYADEIFSLFKRLHSADKYEGSGIGLALCKAVVERYGGRIWVESVSGLGSRFFFTLPIIDGRSKSAGVPAGKSKTVGVF